MYADGEWGTGAEGDRTLDLRIANATLSQLSYRPIDDRPRTDGRWLRKRVPRTPPRGARF